MADSPSFVDARAELTPETAGDNGAPTAATTVPNERTGSRRQLFTDIHVQGEANNRNNEVDDDVSVLSAVIVEPRPTIREQTAPEDDGLDVEEEIDGDGDSLSDAEDVVLLDSATQQALRSRLEVLVKLEDDIEEAVLDGEANQTPFGVEGLDELTSLPKIPDDWVLPEPLLEANEPPFDEIDNPGKWHPFTLKPVYDKKHPKRKVGPKNPSKYVGHFLSTGCTVVPKGEDGKRVVEDWEFFYDGWNEDLSHHHGATRLNPFPEERKGKLDYPLLKKLGLTGQRLKDQDALFFFQLLFPICDTSKSGIDGDPRMSYYSKVQRWSAKYASEIGLFDDYGHVFHPPKTTELLYFDMALVRDGVVGGSDGAIYRRWQPGKKTYDADIAASLTWSCWKEIKRVLKLCDNSTAKKRGEEGYDLAYKFDYIVKCLVHNINCITEDAELDLCGDETTWAHMGFGERLTALLARIMRKPGVTKGGQTVILTAPRLNPAHARGL